jgi:hypothetical protein
MIGLLQDGSSGAYEISDAIMGAAMLEQLEPIKDSIGTNVANISELRAMCERKLDKEELKANCEMAFETNPSAAAGGGANPLVRIKVYVDEQVEALAQSKADKASVDKRLTATSKALKAEFDEGLEGQRSEIQEALSSINTNIDSVQGSVEILERDVTTIKEKLANDPLPALIEEQKKREKDIYMYIEGQMARFGLQQEDIARLTSTLDEKPSEKQVRAMMASLHDKLQSKYGNSDAIAMMVENLKLDVRRKTNRDDVLRLVGASVKEMADQLKLPDDTLMAGRLQYRCLTCNHSLPQMHDNMAEKVIHAGVAPVSSTQAAPGPVPQMFKQPNQLVLATYPNGRAGALRPLQRQQQAATPMSQTQLSGTGDSSLGNRNRRAQTASGTRHG